MSRNTKGFSLLELLMAIATTSLLSVTAVPSLLTFIEKQQTDTAAQNTLRHIYSARKLAVNTGQHATFCGVDKTHRCSKTDFEHWAIFIDENENRQVDDGETIEWLAPTDHAGTVTSNKRYIVFNEDGSARHFGSVMICAGSGDLRHARRISINRAGRPYIVPKSKKSGLVTKSNGDSITCEV